MKRWTVRSIAQLPSADRRAAPSRYEESCRMRKERAAVPLGGVADGDPSELADITRLNFFGEQLASDLRQEATDVEQEQDQRDPASAALWT